MREGRPRGEVAGVEGVVLRADRVAGRVGVAPGDRLTGERVELAGRVQPAGDRDLLALAGRLGPDGERETRDEHEDESPHRLTR